MATPLVFREVVPASSYDAPESTELGYPFGRPSVVILPNGNVFSAVTVFSYTDGGTVIGKEGSRAMLITLHDADLNELDRKRILTVGYDGNQNGGTRPAAFNIYDQTVWLFQSGSDNTLHMIDCRNDMLTVVESTTLLPPDPIIGSLDVWYEIFYTNQVGQPQVLKFPEFNMDVLCGSAFITFKNGAPVKASPDASSNFETVHYRNPSDPTKFGRWFYDYESSYVGTPPPYISKYIYTTEIWEYTLDPTTGLVTGPEVLESNTFDADDFPVYFSGDTPGTVGAQPSIFVLASPNPYITPSVAMSERYDGNTGTNPVDFIDLHTFVCVETILAESPGRTGFIGYLGDLQPVIGGEHTVISADVAYADGSDDFTVLRLIESRGGANPEYKVNIVDHPFLTMTGGRMWDTLLDGSTAAHHRNGRMVMAFTLLDETGNDEQGVGFYLVSFEAGEPDPLKLKLEDDTFEGVFVGGAGPSGGAMNVKTKDGWHHEWSTADDIEDRTKLRYPLKLKMPNGKWKCVGVFTPTE